VRDGRWDVSPLSKRGTQEGFSYNINSVKITLNLPLPKGEVNCRILKRLAYQFGVS